MKNNFSIHSTRKKFYLLIFMFIWLGVECGYAQTFISVKGKHIVDAKGNVLILKGTNLGNWLVPEGYMFKFNDVSSPANIDLVFNQLVGPVETAKFWDKY